QVSLHIVIFEACSAFTQVTARTLAETLNDPFHPEASARSWPSRLLRLLPAGATLAGRDLHPLKNRAFPRHTTSPPLRPGLSFRYTQPGRLFNEGAYPTVSGPGAPGFATVTPFPTEVTVIGV